MMVGLNECLKKSKSTKTVVAFIIMPANNGSFTVESLKGQAVTKKLMLSVEDIQKRIGKRIYESILRGKMPECDKLLSENDEIVLKRHIFALERYHLPAIVTHNITDNENDPILCQLRRLRLFNDVSDRVKVIFHPEFLSSNSPILGLDYEEFVRGCHLGVFPSYYEPWGYTPAECTVLGIPSITTNLSGFGCFMEDHVENPNDYGIFIVDRRMKSVEESVNQLKDYMLTFCQWSQRQRINSRNRTERLGVILDWKTLGIEYRKARFLALSRKYPELVQGFETASSQSKPEKIPRPLSVPPSPKLQGQNIEFDEDPSALK